jgi:flagellar hook protein FlgE
MLKSLYSGVAGLQSHQVAMDIESNNIANVNTVGFKYSRANFSDLLAQTKSIATAPQGDLGGQNAVQVGLGSTVSSKTTIFSQGSIQNTDKNTDVAIQGDGFFIVSADGGNSYKYTRAGDFKFDAGGNFVDNNGFIVQGWVRDPITGEVDATAPIENINIPPGLTTPASPTAEVVLKANLNAGTLVESFSPAYAVPSGDPTNPFTNALPAADENGLPVESGDMGVLFNDAGEAFSLQDGQGIWMSFVDAEYTGESVVASDGYLTADDDAVTYTFDAAVADGETISIIVNGTTYTATMDTTVGSGTETAEETYDALGAAVAAGEPVTYSNVGEALTFTNNTDDGTVGAVSSPVTVSGMANDNGTTKINESVDELDLTFTLDDGTTQRITTVGGTGEETPAQNGARYVTAINAQTATTGVMAQYNTTTGKIELTNTNSNTASSHNINVVAGNVNSGIAVDPTDPTAVTSVNIITAHTYTYSATGGLGGSGGLGNDKTFTTIADLRNQMELEANKDIDGDGLIEGRVEVTVTDQGKIEVTNPGGSEDDYDISLSVTAYSSVGSPTVTENTRFTSNMEAMNASLAAGSTGKAFSQSFNAATHSSSIDIFDSLGSKHTIRMEFRKTELSVTTGSRWDMKISVPPPAMIDNTAPTNERSGFISFGPDGSLSNFDPPNVSFTGNNGSSSEQQVKLTFGTTGMYDGMTSFDSSSSTSGISQDGFTGGDLVGVRIDQSGTIVGSFSNGRSFGLAQVGMAKFTNNEGLSAEGGSVYVQTANSGDPIIGSAATSGRGFIQSSALEASNVDLSMALTQLIIIQRGYQANGKIITTSDQLLETLIGLKR